MICLHRHIVFNFHVLSLWGVGNFSQWTVGLGSLLYPHIQIKPNSGGEKVSLKKYTEKEVRK